MEETELERRIASAAVNLSRDGFLVLQSPFPIPLNAKLTQADTGTVASIIGVATEEDWERQCSDPRTSGFNRRHKATDGSPMTCPFLYKILPE